MRTNPCKKFTKKYLIYVAKGVKLTHKLQCNSCFCVHRNMHSCKINFLSLFTFNR